LVIPPEQLVDALNRVILPIFLLVGVSFGQGYGSIEGTVTDEGGMVISGATVYAFSIRRPTASAIPSAETDAEGHYIFKRLDYGRYAVAPAKPADDYPTPWHVPNCAHMKYPEIELSDENQSAKFDLRFGKKAGVLVGTVTDADSGNPIDANVEFRCIVDPNEFVSGSGLTNARFRVLVPSDTPVSMTVSQTGFENWHFTRNGVVEPILLAPGETLTLEIRLKKNSASHETP
jgi:Carboxypeptidase regulatory-like domain